VPFSSLPALPFPGRERERRGTRERNGKIHIIIVY
jgi:hypothetical protein